MRSYLGSLTAPCSATGLTGLDQATGLFSWGAWVYNRRTSATAISYLWSHTDNAAAVRHGIAISLLSRGRIDCTVSDATTGSITSPSGFCMGGWMHIGVRLDGARAQLYRNGVLSVETALTKVPDVSGTRQTAIGQSAGGTISFHPDIFDVRVFPGVALSIGEMKLLPDPTAQLPFCKQRLFYQQNWRHTGGTVTVRDESGNGNHLTTTSTTLDCDTAPEPDWYGILGMRRFSRRANVSAPAGVALKAYSLYW